MAFGHNELCCLEPAQESLTKCCQENLVTYLQLLIMLCVYVCVCECVCVVCVCVCARSRGVVVLVVGEGGSNKHIAAMKSQA